MQNRELINYNDGEIELAVSLDSETVWLSLNQLCELFARDKSVISRHIRNIFDEGELEKSSTVAKNATVQIEGGREVVRDIEHYNLDVIISVGYRVKSQRGVRFRQWATSVLRSYITNGFVINSEKITHERFKELENDVSFLKSKVFEISNAIGSGAKPKQGIFYNGQIFDAYAFINDLLQDAKKSVVLIDNYIDRSVFVLFSKYPLIRIEIYTQTIGDQLRLDYEKYQKQYKNIELRTTKNFHDRFLIIDDQLYHIGASLKDLGNKIFAFSKLNVDIKEFLGKL